MMLETIRRKLEQYEGTWLLPDDLDALLEIIEGAMGEGLEYSPSRPRKHWRECWRYASHHACAVAAIEALRQANAKVRQENALLRGKLDEMGFDWSVLLEEETGARGALGEP